MRNITFPVPIPPTPRAEGIDDMDRGRGRAVTLPWTLTSELGSLVKVLLIAVLCLTAVCVFLGLCLSWFALRPPIVLDQNAGYLMVRTTDIFRLSNDNVSAWTDLVLTSLYTSEPGNPSLLRVSRYVSKKVLAIFQKPDEAMLIQSNERRTFTYQEVRAYSYPKYDKKYLMLAVRGELNTYKIDATALRQFTVETVSQVNILYVRRTIPNPQNPFGMVLEYIDTKTGTEADKIWDICQPLKVSKDERLPPPEAPDALPPASSTNPTP